MNLFLLEHIFICLFVLEVFETSMESIGSTIASLEEPESAQSSQKRNYRAPKRDLTLASETKQGETNKAWEGLEYGVCDRLIAKLSNSDLLTMPKMHDNATIAKNPGKIYWYKILKISAILHSVVNITQICNQVKAAIVEESEKDLPGSSNFLKYL